MTDDDVVITLTRDQALVLSDWLDRMMGTAAFDALVDQDRAHEFCHPHSLNADTPPGLEAERRVIQHHERLWSGQ